MSGKIQKRAGNSKMEKSAKFWRFWVHFWNFGELVLTRWSISSDETWQSDNYPKELFTQEKQKFFPGK
jgi:hypothetical protein